MGKETAGVSTGRHFLSLNEQAVSILELSLFTFFSSSNIFLQISYIPAYLVKITVCIPH
jgi:hypothetical protein